MYSTLVEAPTWKERHCECWRCDRCHGAGGNRHPVQHSLLQEVIVGRRCRIINSVIEGHPEWPVVIGDDVTLINCHVRSTGKKSTFAFCGWEVAQAQTRLGDGVSFSNSRLLNTVVEAGSSGFGASIEYSHIGPQNSLRLCQYHP